jgi:hypothetical protein
MVNNDAGRKRAHKVQKDIKPSPNPMRAIRQKCLHCCVNSYKEIELCHSTACALFPFRMGVNPWREPRTVTAVQRARLNARLPVKAYKDDCQGQADALPIEEAA